MSNFYNTTGIDVISMVQEEQTEFNVLTEGFFGSIGDFIKRLWNGVISFIRKCYNKIKDFLKRIFGKKKSEDDDSDYTLFNFSSFTRNTFEKWYNRIDSIFKSDLELYDSIKNNNGSNSLIQSMNIIKRSRDNVAGSVLISADFSMNGTIDHSVYLPNGKVLINDNAYFKYSDEVFEGLKEIHEFYVECEKRLLDLVENYNKRLADNYKWFDELLKDPNVANDPDMKNILSGVKESSTDSAKHITELSSKILKYTQELEKVILKMSSK